MSVAKTTDANGQDSPCSAFDGSSPARKRFVSGQTTAAEPTAAGVRSSLRQYWVVLVGYAATGDSRKGPTLTLAQDGSRA